MGTPNKMKVDNGKKRAPDLVDNSGLTILLVALVVAIVTTLSLPLVAHDRGGPRHLCQ